MNLIHYASALTCHVDMKLDAIFSWSQNISGKIVFFIFTTFQHISDFYFIHVGAPKFRIYATAVCSIVTNPQNLFTAALLQYTT